MGIGRGCHMRANIISIWTGRAGRILKAVLVMLLAFDLCLPARATQLMVVSDLHYMARELYAGSELFLRAQTRIEDAERAVGQGQGGAGEAHAAQSVQNLFAPLLIAVHQHFRIGLAGKPVAGSVAMTGEISLTGRVMPIGGLKEKTMAAYKAGIHTVIIPEENVPDLGKVDKTVRGSLEFVPVRRLDDVWNVALKKDGQAHEI